MSEKNRHIYGIDEHSEDERAAMDFQDILNDDNDIRELFAGFNPPLSSSTEFINKTISQLDGYRIVKESIETGKRNYTVRCSVALLIGFICGATLTFFFPYIESMISELTISLFDAFNSSADTMALSNRLPEYPELYGENLQNSGVIGIITWIFISIVTLGATFSGFRLSAIPIK